MIKFCGTLKKTVSETTVLLQVFGTEVLEGSTIRQWQKDFKASQKSAYLQPLGDMPRTVMTEVNNNTVTAVIAEDHHLAAQTIATQLNIKSRGRLLNSDN